MKRFVIPVLLVACSSGEGSPAPCQPSSCADFQGSMPHVCGKVDDGCGKQLDCGPCDVSGLGGAGGAGGGDSCTLSGQVSVVSTTSSSVSSSFMGQGGSNMCQDLTFDK